MKTSANEHLPETQQHHRLHSFASPGWYEATIRFAFTFTAKTSEVLLAAGLISSTANFLTDGSIMSNNPNLASAWAWAQALAIDSSLGVTCYYLFINIKQRDWIKVLCYGLLTLLLAVVAGTITNVDTLSHAIHTTISGAITQVGLNVKALTTLRAIAVVGFLLMSRLKDVSFKDLHEPLLPQEPSSLQPLKMPEDQKNERTVELIKELITEALAPFMAASTQLKQTIIVEEQETLPLPAVQTTAEPSEQQGSPPNSRKNTKGETKLETQKQPGEDLPYEEREDRLTHAYHELQAEGERISGRSLAARAHIRRSTCNQWLATHHPEVGNDEPEEELEHGQLQRLNADDRTTKSQS